MGMMPISVNGTTSPIRVAETSHPAPAPMSHASAPLRKLSNASGACIQVARL